MVKTYDLSIDPTWALCSYVDSISAEHGPNLIFHTDEDRKCKVRLYEEAASNFTPYG